MGGPKTHKAHTAKPAATPAAGKDGHKFTPRPPAPVAERLPKLYRALTDQVNDGFFDNAKKTCKKVLALDPTSTSAFQTLLFLHLHTDDYAAALALVTNPPSKPESPLDFEVAYCLYRLHREKEALAALDKIAKRGRREEHLEAQVRYRLGEYETAQKIYDDLLASSPAASSEYDDIRTNQTATAAHLAFIQRDYRQHLSAPPVEAAGLKPYTVPAGEIESYVPSIPAGWAPRGSLPKVAAVASTSTSTSAPKEEKKRAKPRHALPKGAVPGKPFTQDPDRWLPLRQRASFAPTTTGKKKKEQTGLGTQGSTGGGGGGGHGGGGGGGGGGKKKGKKK